MFEHFLRSKARVRAVAVLAALGTGMVFPSAAQAVRPGVNGRIAYLKAAPGGGYDVQVFFDHRFNKRLTDSHDFLDRVTWCGSDTLVAVEAGVGLLAIPLDPDANAGSPYVLYDDPANTLRDAACDPSGTRVAAADLSTKSIVTIPVSGRRGVTSPVAFTALDGIPREPAWSSSGDYIAYEDDAITARGVSVIEVAATSRHFVGSGTVVTPATGGFRHGPSWREDKIYYWMEVEPRTAPPTSRGIFSVRLGDLNEFGPYGGTQAERCTDPAALPDGDGFLCVGADTFIKLFPGPRTLIDTDARKPDVERRGHYHAEEHHGDDHHHGEHHADNRSCRCEHKK